MKKFNREMTEFFDKLYAGEARSLVYGEGRERAALMLIGEAPGEQETLLGKPFVGKAGKNLDYFLEKTGFCRDTLYITNAVKFRTVKRSAAGRLVNRAPTFEEVELFLPWLKREIALVKPQCVVTMGNTALRALMGKKAVVGDMHGSFHRMDDGQLLYALYHPASLIYNRQLALPYERDLTLLREWRARQSEAREC